MRKAAAWKLLGIAATTDTRDIRRAYAAKLKAGDYDSDAQAFMALREARDYALNAAQWGEAPDVEIEDEPGEEAEGDFEFVSWKDEESAVVSVTEQAADRAEPDPPSPFQGHCQALHDALFDEESTADLEPLLLAVLNDPQMDEIGTRADTELWLSDIIADRIPRSDRLILPVGRFFGWQARVGQIGLPWSVAYLVQRQKALYFFDAVQVKGHSFYREWKELTKPADATSKRSWGLRQRNVNELIQLVRSEHPDLESCFDIERVALWDTGQPSVSSGRTVSWWWAPFVILQIFLAMGKCSNDFSPKDSLAPPIEIKTNELLSDKKADINFALRGTDLTANQIEKANPKFYTALSATWQVAFDAKKEKWDFIPQVKELIDDQYRYGASTSPYDLVADRQRLNRDMAKFLRSTKVENCDGYFNGKGAPAGIFPQEYYAQQQALVARTVLEVGGVAKKSSAKISFSIPGATVTRVEALTKLPTERVAKAFMRKGSPAENCNVGIALIDAALEAPRGEGLKMLRGM